MKIGSVSIGGVVIGEPDRMRLVTVRDGEDWFTMIPMLRSREHYNEVRLKAAEILLRQLAREGNEEAQRRLRA